MSPATRPTAEDLPSRPRDASDGAGLAAGDTLGRYRLVRAIGEGGMGAVFEAVHDDIGRRVAIKVLRPELARREAARTRFFREARAAARVRHPGVVQVHDVDTDDDTAFLVMDLLPGETLAARLARGPLAPRELVDALLPALDGVACAHEAGVVHRDLKPANLLLVPSPEGPRAVVLDFGVSRLVDEDSDLTGSLAVLGTPAYMSPEQARGARDVGPASDQFSLGAVLYACLAGRRPFDGQSPLELAFHIQRNARPALAEAAPGAPPALVAVIERAMATDVADRFPSVRAFADALRAAVDAPARLSPRRAAVWALALAAVALAVPLAWRLLRPPRVASAAPAPAAHALAASSPSPAPVASTALAPPTAAPPPAPPALPTASPAPRPPPRLAVRRVAPAAPAAPLAVGRNRAPVLGR